MTEIDSKFVAREKEKARELRRSRWWQNLIAQAQCYYCQKELNSKTATMDHLLPISKGGRSTKGNVVVSCKECNNKKRDLTSFDLHKL